MNRTTSWVLILAHLKRRKETEQQNSLQSDHLPQTPAVLTSLLGWSVTVNHNKPYPSQVACLIVLSQWQDQKLRQHLSDHRWCGLATSHHPYRAFTGFPYNLQMTSWDASSALWDLLLLSSPNLRIWHLMDTVAQAKVFYVHFILWLSQSACFLDCKSFDCATKSKNFEIWTHFTKVLWLPQHKFLQPWQSSHMVVSNCSLSVTSLVVIWATLITSHTRLTKPIHLPPFRAPLLIYF